MKNINRLFGALLLSGAAAAQNSSDSTTEEGLLSSGNIDLGVWSDAYTKATALVAGLSNNEKITLITGGSVTSFAALQFKDGTQGVQGYEYVTGFSLSSALVNTFDRTLMYDQFAAVAAEFYGKGFQVTNAPTSGPLGRTPWGGRTVEGLGSDPYLNGIAFGLGAKAFSDTGIIAGGKHFLLNEQETNRMGMGASSTVAPYSSVVDDKALHETYLWAFYDGVKNGLGAMMSWIPGFVFPDVSGQSTAFGSANGGLDYGSSSIWKNTTLIEGISNGTLTQARLDDMAVRNVTGYYFVGRNNGSQPAFVSSSADVDVRANHAQIVRTNGAASLSLLKNSNNTLPLNKPLSIAMFGSHAGPVMAGPNYVFSVQGTPSTYDGHLAGGAGSGQTSFPYLITPQQAITNRASADGTMIRWILNNTYTSSDSTMDGGGFKIPGLSGGTSLTQTIPDYATDADVCIAFINAFSGEGEDRTELRNTEQDTMITTIAANCPNTVVVVNTVGPRILDSWIENENVTAVIYGGLIGQESGNSLVDVLYGDFNPSARLSYTIAKNESDYNVPICDTAVCNFTEGNYIDYRHFDQANIDPRFEFGFGLSYTTFDYSDVSATITNNTAAASIYPTGTLSVGGKADLWDEMVSVTVTLSNNGTVAGNEVSQLYLQYPDAADEPIRQLRGFERTLLAPGASSTVTFSVRRRDMSSWDVAAQDWAVVRGNYIFSVGASSRDLRGSSTVTI